MPNDFWNQPPAADPNAQQAANVVQQNTQAQPAFGPGTPSNPGGAGFGQPVPAQAAQQSALPQSFGIQTQAAPAGQQGFGAQAPAAAPNIAALAGQIASAEVSKKSLYLDPGSYPLLQIQACKFITSSKDGSSLFILEAQVLQSQVGSRTPGMEVAWIANLSKHQPAAGNVRSLIAAALGQPAEAIDPAAISQVVGPQNPLRGRLIMCEVKLVKTRQNKDFSKHMFFAVDERYQANADAIRAQCLGGGT